MTDLHDWFIEQYDKYVNGEGLDGVIVEKSRDAIAHAYASAVESGEIERYSTDLVAEGREQFNRLVMPVRERRRGAMRADLEFLVDALADNTILGRDDPALTLSYPVGDGSDKVLRLWTAEDWETSRTTRYRGAAEVTKAAASFDEDLASDFIHALKRSGKRTTGELFS